MSTFRKGRDALSISIGAVLLAACSGGQAPSISAMPPQTTVKVHAKHGHSWMLKEATSESLLYVTTNSGYVDVLSYPEVKLVGELTDIDAPQGVCTDARGNVFITAYWTEDVLEFAHGGTSPIAKLGDYGYYPNGCSVDPTTGNLAVANDSDMTVVNDGNLAIYKKAQGKPTDYTAPGFNTFYWCAYDDGGNLLVDNGGSSYAIMPAGSYTLQVVNLDLPGNGIHWDGSYFAIVNSTDKQVNRVTISGSSGSVHSTLTLKGLISQLGYDFVLAGTKIIIPYATSGDENFHIATARYPLGGRLSEPFKIGKAAYYAMALSK